MGACGALEVEETEEREAPEWLGVDVEESTFFSTDCFRWFAILAQIPLCGLLLTEEALILLRCTGTPLLCGPEGRDLSGFPIFPLRGPPTREGEGSGALGWTQCSK